MLTWRVIWPIYGLRIFLGPHVLVSATVRFILVPVEIKGLWVRHLVFRVLRRLFVVIQRFPNICDLSILPGYFVVLDGELHVVDVDLSKDLFVELEVGRG